MGATDRRTLDGGQRARRPRRRDTSGLPDLGPRRRFLRLALLLLGADGGRSGAAGCGRGRQGHQAGLRAGRAHRVARSMLVAGRDASGLPGRHGHRAARLLEPQHTEWLQGRLRAVRERAPGRAAAGYSDRVPRTGRAGVLWTTGRGNTRSRRLYSGGGRRWRCDLARNGRAAGLSEPTTACAGERKRLPVEPSPPTHGARIGLVRSAPHAAVTDSGAIPSSDERHILICTFKADKGSLGEYLTEILTFLCGESIEFHTKITFARGGFAIRL